MRSCVNDSGALIKPEYLNDHRKTKSTVSQMPQAGQFAAAVPRAGPAAQNDWSELWAKWGEVEGWSSPGSRMTGDVLLLCPESSIICYIQHDCTVLKLCRGMNTPELFRKPWAKERAPRGLTERGLNVNEPEFVCLDPRRYQGYYQVSRRA